MAVLVIFSLLWGQDFLVKLFFGREEKIIIEEKNEEIVLPVSEDKIIERGDEQKSNISGSFATAAPVPISTPDSPILSPTPIQELSPELTPTITPTPVSTPRPTLTPAPIPTSNPTPTPTPSPTPDSTVALEINVVINEIAWMGTIANANHEWIELYNPNPFPVDISGWSIKAIDGTPNIIIAPDKIMAAFSYFLLERISDTTISDISADQIYTGILSNGGEVIELIDNNGQIRDKVGHFDEYGQISIWYAGESNTSTDPAIRISMERIDYSKPGDDPSNWRTNNGIIVNGFDSNSNFISGTPKALNSQ